MEKLKVFKDRKKEAVAEMDAMVNPEGEDSADLSAEQQTAFEALVAECETLSTSITNREAFLKHQATLATIDRSPVVDRVITEQLGEHVTLDDGAKIVVPSRIRQTSLVNFKGPQARENAYSVGMWILACNGAPRAQRWCGEHNIDSRFYSDAQITEMFGAAGQQETINTTGGYLVPDAMDTAIQDLALVYGVFRNEARRLAMTSDTASRPRKTDGLTAYWVGESAAGTQSNSAWDQIKMSAKKLFVLTKMSSELSEDAIINVADDLVGDIAQAFAYAEDVAGFNGTGLSTHGGINGIITLLSSLNGADDGGGLVLAAGNTYAEVTLANLHAIIGRTPTYALGNSKWYASRSCAEQTLVRLNTAAGGNTGQMLSGGIPRTQSLGYPIVPVEIMSTTEANSQICLLFGDMRQSSTFGDRRGTTIAFTTEGTIDGESMFEQDEIGVRGTERIDLNNHTLGTATVPGPVMGLILAAS